MVHYIGESALICLFLYIICYAVAIPSHKANKNRDVVIPIRTDAAGNFMSHTIPHKFNKHVKRASNTVHYRVPMEGEHHHLQLEPNHNIISPGGLIEIHDTIGGVKSRKLKQFSDNHCHFTGSVKGDVGSTAAVSTCDGLTGYIRTKRGYFMIEPMKHDFSEGAPHKHIVYKHEIEQVPNCGTNTSRYEHLTKKNVREADLDGNITVAELHIETMVVLDHAILKYHNQIDIENFVLTVFNIAHNLFHDSSLGTNINLAIVRLMRLEVEEHEMNIASTKNPGKTLEFFRHWQAKVNPTEDSHPNHHDVAILLTRLDICADEKSCGFLGAARIAGMCDLMNAAIICQDNGLPMGFTIAHEIGHTLGLIHDHVNHNQVGKTVMASCITPESIRWSNCSNQHLRKFIQSGSGGCMYDPPTEHNFVLSDALPGIMYDPDYQCKEMFGPNAALCMTGVICSNLICYIEDKGCVETFNRPADGTTCGQNKWCFHGECVEIGERPKAVDGKWSEWDDWSECTRTCGSGVAAQERHCNNPAPSNGGKYCAGEHRRYRICSTEPCQFDEISFRDKQCMEFNSWRYPEDRKIHQWKSYPIHDENPCALFCINELGAVAALRPRVIDGTACYHGIRNICINGICKEIPCDLDLQSNAVEDRCGVCRGDGTTCKVVRGEKSYACGKGPNQQKILDIPAGAINVKIEEETPSESRIELRDEHSREIVLSGDTLGTISIFGVLGWVGMIRTKQEAMSIPGPLPKGVTVWIEVEQNSTVIFSYGVKANDSRCPIFAWDFLDWSRCTSECGPGTQEAVAKCVEKEAGLVDEKYCGQLPKPKEVIRGCELAPCIPRWFVGEWQQCNRCPRGISLRIVRCVRPVGSGEGELHVIPECNCAGPKPHSSQSCVCHPNQAPDNERFDKNNTSPKVVVEFLRKENVRLVVHSEGDSNKMPRPKGNNEPVYELKAEEALRFMGVMQKDFSNNRTRI